MRLLSQWNKLIQYVDAIVVLVVVDDDGDGGGGDGYGGSGRGDDAQHILGALKPNERLTKLMN